VFVFCPAACITSRSPARYAGSNPDIAGGKANWLLSAIARLAASESGAGVRMVGRSE